MTATRDVGTAHGAADERMTPRGQVIVFGIFVAMVVDGMDLQMLSLALPSLSKELQLSSIGAGALGTYTLAGMGIGGVLAGRLSDRIGRVRVVWWAILTFSLCTAVIGFSRSYEAIAAMRFLSGFGIAALYSIGTLVVTEYVPTRIRTTMLGIVQAGWSAGYVVAALLGSFVLPRYGWRPLFLFAIVPGVLTLLLLRGLPDPPSWTSATRRPRGQAPRGFGGLWRDAAVRTNFLAWTATSIALQFGYYGANTWLPSYLVQDLKVDLQSMGWYVAATYTMMCLGKVVTGYLADRLGRKAMWVAAGLLTALYVPLFIFLATPSNIAYLLLVFGFLYGAPYAVSATYMCESFPSSVRATAVGAAYNLGRIGATISPLLIGLAASRYSIGLGLALLGISYALCAVIPGLLIPERLYDPNAVDEVSQPLSRTA